MTVELIDKMNDLMDKGESVIEALLDLSKASDTIHFLRS